MFIDPHSGHFELQKIQSHFLSYFFMGPGLFQVIYGIKSEVYRNREPRQRHICKSPDDHLSGKTAANAVTFS